MRTVSSWLGGAVDTASLCLSSRATKKPWVRVLVVLARRHWVRGSRPRSCHWGRRRTNL